jgi:cobalt-zinc-cadmium efflux system protein
MHRHAEASYPGPFGGGTAAGSQWRLLVVLVLTAGYMVVEVAGGLLAGSLALLADAGHMLADVVGLSMALMAIRFAQRPATPAKTYGFYRGEILAALANSLLLLAIAAFILYEAWRRFVDPPEVHTLPMLLVAAGGVAVNLVGIRLLHAASAESLNVQGAFLEVYSDLLGSLAALLAGAIIALTGWRPADPLFSALIALFIVPRSWRLLTNALDVLLEAAPAHIDLGRLESELRGVSGVAAVHDLHVWSITSGFVAMSGHVLAGERRSSDVLHDVRLVLRERFGIEHATLQVERLDHADDGACCALDPRCLVVSRADVVE